MIVGVAGVAIAAPDAMALVVGWLARRLRALRALLARVIPFLRHDVNVDLPTARGKVGATVSMTLKKFQINGDVLVWDSEASADAKADLLHEQLLKVFAKITEVRQDVNEARQEATAGDAALRERLEARVGELAAESQQMRQWLEARDRRAARVDARGLFPIALSIVMTGISVDLANISWLGWIFVLGAPAATFWIGLRVRSDSAVTGRSPAAAG